MSARPGSVPYRALALVLVCVLVAFGVAVAVGALEVRRPVKSAPPPPPEPEQPKSYIHRVRSAESLLDNQNVLWVYKFAGGLPKCWVEIDSEGHKQTLGPWVSAAHHSPFLFGKNPSDGPILESIEGYVALFVPAFNQEQKYRLVCAVTKIEDPPDPNREILRLGFREPLEVKLPDLLPPRAVPKDAKAAAPDAKAGPLEVKGTTASGGVTLEDGENPQFIPYGQDATINFLRGLETPSGKERSIELKIRFLTAEEIAAKR
jgi:hypothetical protein